MDKPKEVLVPSNHLMMLEKVGPERIKDGKVFQDFTHVPKHDPTGQGRISPNRSLGESESRLSGMVTDGLIKAEQLEQVLFPRGFMQDIDTNLFRKPAMGGHRTFTERAIIPQPLVETIANWIVEEDGVDSNLFLTGANADFDGNALDGGVYDIDASIFSRINPGRLNEKPESTSASKALVQEPLKSVEYANRKMRALVEGGMSPAEAERKIAYVKAELKRMRLEAAEEASKADQAYDRELYNRQYASPLLHAQAFEDHINSILEAQSTGWKKRVEALRKQQAEILAQVNASVNESVEPPPPPPVMDFSTADLEQPERFIIKDLEGFKFDPDAKFDGLRLPYESCLFVLGEEPLRAVVLATQEDDDVLSLKLLSEQKAELPWHSIATLYVRLNGTKARLKWANTKRTLDKRLGMVSSVLAFLAGEQLGDVEVTTVVTAPEGREIPPPKPGYCYNVVNIVHEKRKALRRDWQGGTHASPREHKRKGHWWPSPKGGYLWRGPVIVNKGVLGRVDKEYHVTKLEEAIDEKVN